MDFLCTEKLFIANLLQFFPEFNRNTGKDDVIDKSLGFQNAFDSLSILVQLCTCDVGDAAGSKMNHWLTMLVLIFWCSQDDSCPVYPCKYMVSNKTEYFWIAANTKQSLLVLGYLLLPSESPRFPLSVPLKSFSVHAWAEGSLLLEETLPLCHRHSTSSSKPVPWQAGIFCFPKGSTSLS